MRVPRAATRPSFRVVVLSLASLPLMPQLTWAFERVDGYETTGVIVEKVEYRGRSATAVEYESRGFRDWWGMAKSAVGLVGDPPNPIARIPGSRFSNGVIEVDVSSTVVAKLLGLARGFAGIAFRVSDDMESYELVYLRPANGRVEDEVRRAHALQYAAHPDFLFDVSRREAPGKYETGADIGLDEWIRLRIEVDGERAEIFVDGKHALTVDDLKLGPERDGGVALWVGIGTRAYFSNLTIAPGGP